MMRTVHSDDYMSRQFDMRTSNCWHLVRDVWLAMTDVDLGDLTPPQTDHDSLVDAAWHASVGHRFERIRLDMRQPCIVLMRRRAEIPHVGVLMRWRLLHMTPNGVRNPWWSDARREWEHLDFYIPRASGQESA